MMRSVMNTSGERRLLSPDGIGIILLAGSMVVSSPSCNECWFDQ